MVCDNFRPHGRLWGEGLRILKLPLDLGGQGGSYFADSGSFVLTTEASLLTMGFVHLSA